MTDSPNILIVGGGLAGVTLACKLLDENASVTVIDAPRLSASSRIAAGVFNVLVMKRLTLAGLASECLEEALLHYTKTEKTTGQPLLHRHTMLRVHQSAGESNDFLALTADEKYRKHIRAWKGKIPDCLHAPFGCGEITSSGRLHTALYVQACKERIVAQGKWTERFFDPGQLVVQDAHCTYENVVYTAVVFCEGHKVTQNPFWPGLRMLPTGGEVLDVQIPGLPEEHTWHIGVYATPLGNGLFRVGSNFRHNATTDEVAQQGVDEIMQKLQANLKTNATRIAARAGVRPATHDRKPYIGRHSVYKNIFILNGLGSRGVLQAPLAAANLSRVILQNAPVIPEWDVLRLEPRR